MQELPAQSFVTVSSISKLHVGPDQPNPRPDPDPNPITLTPTLCGARGRQGQSRGSAACFGGVFPKKRRADEGPALTNKTRTLHKVLCRTLLHTGRVEFQGFAPKRGKALYIHISLLPRIPCQVSENNLHWRRDGIFLRSFINHFVEPIINNNTPPHMWPKTTCYVGIHVYLQGYHTSTLLEKRFLSLVFIPRGNRVPAKMGVSHNGAAKWCCAGSGG